METQEVTKKRKRLPGWFRFLLWLGFAGVFLGVVLFVAAITAFINFYHESPATPPPMAAHPGQAELTTRTLIGTAASLPATQRAPLDSSAHTSSNSSTTLHADLNARVAASAHKEDAADEFIREAMQPTAELRAKAKAINENFSRLSVEFESYMLEKKKRTDPDEMSNEETKALLAVHERVALIRRDLRSGFSAAEVERFDGVYVGTLADRKDWFEAAIFCADVRGNWKEARYCCRQMESWEGGVAYAVLKFCKYATGSADINFVD